MAQRPSAVRLFADDHPTLARTVKAKLVDRRSELGVQMAEGYASDWPDYNRRAGVIKGLNEAIEICEQAEKDLDKR